MGMDVYGNNPTSKAGEYFRNNVWWWRPLADYIEHFGPAEVVAKCERWHTNEGYGLGADDSIRLADALQALIDQGHTKAQQDEWERMVAAEPTVECKFCGGSGEANARADRAKVAAGYLQRCLAGEAPVAVVEKSEACSNCGGSGRVTASYAYYFDADNVQDFVHFLRASGGFQIR